MCSKIPLRWKKKSKKNLLCYSCLWPMHLHEYTGVHQGNFCSLPCDLALGCELLFPMPRWRDSRRRAGEQWELPLLKRLFLLGGFLETRLLWLFSIYQVGFGTSLSIMADLSKDFLLTYTCSFRLLLPCWLCRFSYCSVKASVISVFRLCWGHRGRWCSCTGWLLWGCRHSPEPAKASLQHEPPPLSLMGEITIIIVKRKDVIECSGLKL